jgi:hypothetical protein
MQLGMIGLGGRSTGRGARPIVRALGILTLSLVPARFHLAVGHPNGAFVPKSESGSHD